MSPRAASTPPLLDGYTYLEPLGSGGFADVFKYEQLRPRREVAVKVLLRGLGADAQVRFEHEANLMALLSNHPSIVSIYASGVAADGRPYLVMENCQARHLGNRIMSRPLQVGRALTIAIQIAGAVETAHRLGILHRDIKPANILFTEFGRPALTDFGISVVEGDHSAVAFSVAWAPPEQIENRPMGPSGDVYSLAATLWAMLAGRRPFDVQGDNGSLAVSYRVLTSPVPKTGRPDVPESLERILRTALAKRPEQRYASALEFARALQAVQAELHESVTTIEVRDERADEDLTDETEGTRVTGFALIDPDAGPDTSRRSFDVSDDQGTRRAGLTTGSSSSGLTGTAPADRTAPDPTRASAHAPFVPPPAVAYPVAPATQSGSAVVMHGRGSRPATQPLEFTGPSIPQRPDVTDRAPAPSEHTGGVAEATGERRSKLPILLGAAAAVLVLGLVIVWVAGGLGPATTSQPTASAAPLPKDPVGEQVARPTELTGKVVGKKAVFTWVNPDPHEGDRYSYRLLRLDTTPLPVDTDQAEATVPLQAGKTCIEVVVVRQNGQFSAPNKKCV